MEIQVLKHFVDQRSGKLYGTGKWDLPDHLANKFINQRKAIPYDEFMSNLAQVQASNPAAVVLGGGDGPFPSPSDSSDLPEGFPEREKLIAAGLGTIEELAKPEARDKIAAIKGVGPTRVSQIGIALSELMAQNL